MINLGGASTKYTRMCADHLVTFNYFDDENDEHVIINIYTQTHQSKFKKRFFW